MHCESGWTISKQSAKDGLVYSSLNNNYYQVREYLLDLDKLEKELRLYPFDIDSICN